MREPFLKALNQLVPAPAVDYCIALWDQTPFSFTLSKKRNSCFGNHIYTSTDGHKISVNHDLSPYAFLVTYIHEVAHLRTVDQHRTTTLWKRRKRIDPHGDEWKRNFQVLMQPLLNGHIFPDHILGPLKNYMANPKASSVSHPALAKVLHSVAEKRVEHIAVGQSFVLRGRTFKLLEFRRTRALCEETSTRRRYLISMIAEVS